MKYTDNRLWGPERIFSFGDSNLNDAGGFLVCGVSCACFLSYVVADDIIICSNYQYNIYNIKMKVVALALLASASAFSPQAAPKFGWVIYI